MALEQRVELGKPAFVCVALFAQESRSVGPNRSQAIRLQMTSVNIRLTNTAADPMSFACPDSRCRSSPNRSTTFSMPVFKSFKARNRILLRPGVMRQFTAATDRISGETVRIEVTLTTVK